jgi:hypothetical protein
VLVKQRFETGARNRIGIVLRTVNHRVLLSPLTTPDLRRG